MAKPFDEPSASRGPARSWRAGNRVLAARGDFLYPGTVSRVSGERAHVNFDDAEQGWAAFDRVQPLEIRRRQQIEVRRPDHRYDPGEVMEVSGTSVQVRLDFGGTRWVSVSAVRLPWAEELLDALPADQERPRSSPTPAAIPDATDLEASLLPLEFGDTPEPPRTRQPSRPAARASKPEPPPASPEPPPADGPRVARSALGSLVSFVLGALVVLSVSAVILAAFLGSLAPNEVGALVAVALFVLLLAWLKGPFR